MASSKSWARRLIVALAVCVTASALFFAEELWRGKRAWERCRRNLEAGGVQLDWAHYMPTPIPDDENVYGVPEMREWFGPTSDFAAKFALTKQPNPAALTVAIATGFLQSNAVFDPRFDRMRAAFQRPTAQITASYSTPGEPPFLNVRAWAAVVRTLALRARCHLILNQSDAALADITLLDDTCRKLIESQRPIRMISLWFDCQGKSACADVISVGIRSNSWNESQLAELEDRLKTSSVLPLMAQAFALERIAICCRPEPLTAVQLARRNFLIDEDHVREGDWNAWVAKISPRGWSYSGSAASVSLDSRIIEAIHPDSQNVDLVALKAAIADFENLSPHWAPKGFMNKFTTDLDKVCRTALYIQTQVTETLVACALERHRLASGNYPATLDALAPRFIEKIPCDVIGGGPLHYRASTPNGFSLYSVGWNEVDDGGTRGSGDYPYTTGDWTW